jgi:hypothetical protein
MSIVLRGAKREKSFKLKWNIKENLTGREEGGKEGALLPPSSKDLCDAF